MAMLQPLTTWLQQQGINPFFVELITFVVAVGLLLALGLLLAWVSRRFLAPWVEKLVIKTKMSWDDTLSELNFFRHLALLVPLLGCYATADLFFLDHPTILPLVKRLLIVLLVITMVRIINTIMQATHIIYNQTSRARNRPIRGYLDALRIVIYILATIFIIAVIADQSPWGILSVLGGLTAVFLLIFRTSLLGFAANLQLTGNNMMQVGDWITMEKYQADGTVEDISLHTVRVRNWDKTYSSIPTYAFMEDSFQNWRGMAESGGRRIKRALYIDMNSVTFCSADMLDHLKKFRLLHDYINNKEQEIAEDNARKEGDGHYYGRRQTNLGIFRAYVESYLRHNDNIKTDLTFLIRHLAPTPQGLPLEIYVFSRDQVWANYERIQADIFDHLLAIIPEFGLRVFQYPSGADLQLLPREQTAGKQPAEAVPAPPGSTS